MLDLQPAEDEEAPPRFALPPKSALLIGTVGFGLASVLAAFAPTTGALIAARAEYPELDVDVFERDVVLLCAIFTLVRM